jgi:hypothetical protein
MLEEEDRKRQYRDVTVLNTAERRKAAAALASRLNTTSQIF